VGYSPGRRVGEPGAAVVAVDVVLVVVPIVPASVLAIVATATTTTVRLSVMRGVCKGMRSTRSNGTVAL
jgi:hypothetical protein